MMPNWSSLFVYWFWVSKITSLFIIYLTMCVYQNSDFPVINLSKCLSRHSLQIGALLNYWTQRRYGWFHRFHSNFFVSQYFQLIMESVASEKPSLRGPQTLPYSTAPSVRPAPMCAASPAVPYCSQPAWEEGISFRPVSLHENLLGKRVTVMASSLWFKHLFLVSGD